MVGRKDPVLCLTSAIDLNSWVEDSNPQSGGVLIDPVLEEGDNEKQGKTLWERERKCDPT